MPNTEQLAKITWDRILNGRFYETGPNSPKCPPVEVLKDIFDVLFYASLRTEEGRPIQVRVYFIDPDNPDPSPPRNIRANRWKTAALGQRIKFTTANLVKFAKAADSWVTGIAIFNSENEGTYIWGLVDQVLHLSTTLVREIQGTYVQPGAFHAVINGPADITVLKETTLVARLSLDLLVTEQNDCFFEGPVSRMIDEWVDSYSRRIIRALGRATGGDSLRRVTWEQKAKGDWFGRYLEYLFTFSANATAAQF